jgi:hypothetical protein
MRNVKKFGIFLFIVAACFFLFIQFAEFRKQRRNEMVEPTPENQQIERLDIFQIKS